jgi:hypothetical protein
MMAYSYPHDLCERLSHAIQARVGKHFEDRTTVTQSVTSGHAPKLWRISDRLSVDDVDRLIDQHRKGSTTKELASDFRIGLTSVK